MSFINVYANPIVDFIKRQMKSVQNPYLRPVMHLGELRGYSFPCPGCGSEHYLPTEISDAEGRRWIFNGNLLSPTFAPSQKIEYIDKKGNSAVCHVNVISGHLDFFDDCSHRLAGRIVPMRNVNADSS